MEQNHLSKKCVRVHHSALDPIESLKTGHKVQQSQQQLETH